MENGGRIFSEDGNGNLVPMRIAAPPSEDELQDLIARFPEIVSEQDGELLLIRREQGIPGEQAGTDRWSLDHLFISRNAVPVLIEVKRASDTRIRREVVGQLLDYAANGVAYWPRGSLEAAFVRTCEEAAEDPDVKLANFLGDGDSSEFWSQAQSNLEAGRLRLVVAADRIPNELARVIEFLNEQMRAEVRAIELRYFQSEDGRRTLAPRMIGETEKARVTKSGGSRIGSLTVEEWLAAHVAPLGEDFVAGARRHMDLMEALGADMIVASTQGSLPARFVGQDGRNVYPFHVQRNGSISVSFGWVSDRPALTDETVRRELFLRFNEAMGKLSTSNLKGYPAFLASKLTDDSVMRAYRDIAEHYVNLAMAGEAGIQRELVDANQVV